MDFGGGARELTDKALGEKQREMRELGESKGLGLAEKDLYCWTCWCCRNFFMQILLKS